MNPNLTTLYAVGDVHGLFVDAIVQHKDTGALLFGSFWGRDTAVQELLARLSLASSEGGLTAVTLADVDAPERPDGQLRIRIDDPGQLAKLTGRMPAANLFGAVAQVWLYVPLAAAPDYAGRRALRLLLADPGLSDSAQRTAAFEGEAAWALFKSVSPVPLLNDWREVMIRTGVTQAWLKFHPGLGVHALEIDLSASGFEAVISGLIRGGQLRLPGDSGRRPPAPSGPADRQATGESSPSSVPRRLTSAELARQLAGFTGTETWFRHSLVRAMLYTEGVQYFAEAGGEQGAYWFLDIVATEFYPLLRKEPFLHIVLTVQDRQATIRVEDGNDRILREKPIEFTDLQPGEWRFYLTDNVLLLPSEY
jgi:hypothetical protein